MSAPFEIPGYHILEKIGSGSTATVWRARQESLDRDVAIKILRPELFTQIDEADAFLAEALAVAQLKSRHIIQVYDTGRLDDTAYIVLEYVAGSTVAQHLKEVGKMAPREAMQIAAAIADALGDAWQSAGIIHRDVKPENIIIEMDGSVKLADLGLARRMDAENDATNAIVGTPNYMSPEQASGSSHVDPTTDMYSLGATLYHMLTGKIPFDGRTVEDTLEAQISEQLPWLQDIDAHIPLSYSQFVARLMMKSPEHRFKDWNVVYHDAVKLAEGRMLMVKLPYDAKSTVANAGSFPAAQKKVIKVSKHHDPLHHAAPAAPSPRIPAWIMRTLRLGRAASIIALLWFLLLRPMLTVFIQPHHPAPEMHTETVAPRPAQTVPAVTPEDDEPYADYVSSLHILIDLLLFSLDNAFPSLSEVSSPAQ